MRYKTATLTVNVVINVRARTPAFGLVGIRMVIMVYGCKRGLE